jgi:hypothetical protein
MGGKQSIDFVVAFAIVLISSLAKSDSMVPTLIFVAYFYRTSSRKPSDL